MKELKIIRQNITANDTTKFEFDVKGYEFLVKNFNDFDIFVSLRNEEDEDKMIKIPAMCSQVCTRNKRTTSGNTSNEVYVYAESTGEVEVQCLKF